MKPNYPMPSQSARTDRVIAERFKQLNAIAARQGWTAARAIAVDELLASIFWLDRVYGSRAAYNFLQTAADELITPVLDDAA